MQLIHASLRFNDKQTINLISNILFITAFWLVPHASSSDGLVDCRGIQGQWAVDSYTDPTPDVRRHLELVNQYHFNQALEKYKASHLKLSSINSIMNDLDYTLRHFPNHHNALLLMSKFQRRLGKRFPSRKGKGGWRLSSECALDRAIRFRPNDPAIYLIHGIHLHQTNNLEAALKAYKKSEKIAPESAEVQYNLGLLYFDRNEYALAKEHAIKAYNLGFPLPGLRNRLKKVGKWP